ncbi:MAG: IclR family transcriptional regulator [Phenylobacterium sp.]|nr:IclR family transcriptional regulator [Phenylobacterium sp.]
MDTTVAKGLAVLALLARAEAPLRLSQIAQDLDLQKSNTHRLLSTLSELGYVRKEAETGRYAPTLKLWELGACVVSAHPVKRAAAPYLQELHRITNETTTLSLLDGRHVLVLDKIVAPRALRFTSRPGSRIPAPLNASGLAMLAQESNPEPLIRAALLESAHGKDVSVPDILEELDLVRSRGYALMLKSKYTPGVVGVAASLPTRDGHARAALSASGPEERFTGAHLEEIIEAVRVIAARVANATGAI